MLTSIQYTYLALSCIPIKHDVILAHYKCARLKIPLHKTIALMCFVNGFFSVSQRTTFEVFLHFANFNPFAFRKLIGINTILKKNF